MTYGCGKSDSAILAGKPTNKAEQSAAESVERRVEAKGNTGQQSTYRAQDRESVSQALDRIRRVARHRKKEKFTALFHHITAQLLREATLNVPVVPPLLSVMVSVSVAPVLGSLIVTPANGCTGASDVVVCPATVPLMVGAPAGSVLITVVLLLTVGVASALLRSLSVNVVVVLEPGAPAFGVKTSACSSLVMVAAAAAANV